MEKEIELNKQKKDILYKYSEEAMDILLSEAKEQFDSIELADSLILARANTFLQVLILVLTTLITYIISQENIYSLRSGLSLFFLFCVSTSLYFCFKAARLKKYRLKGTKPSMIISDFFLNREDNIKEIKYTLIRDIEKSININSNAQKERVIIYRASILVFIVGLVVTSLLFILSNLLIYR